MKPAYVSIEFWRIDRDDTATIEGWMTTDFMLTDSVLVCPSIDYDPAIMQIAIAWGKIISITPTQSVREYGNQQSLTVAVGKIYTYEELAKIFSEDRDNTLIEGEG